MSLGQNFRWENEIPNRKFKSIAPVKLRQFGLDPNVQRVVEKIEDLRGFPPNIVIAEAQRNLKFIQNFFKEQWFKKKQKYVMGLGVYQQLQCDPNFGPGNLLKPATVKFKNLYKPYTGQSLDDKTLLVFRTGGIGDLLFIQPNLYYLKEKYPTCRIHFACGPQYQSMVETWECVDKVLDLPFHLNELIKADYHALFEGVIERCKEAEYTNAYTLFTKWMGINLSNEKLIPRQLPKFEKLNYCKQILDKWNLNDFLIFQIKASSPIRTPSPDFWLSIINEVTDLGYNVVITDTPKQAEQIQNFINQCKNKDKVFNFAKYSESLDCSIALVSLSKCVVATDSALTHIAASMNVSCFGMYGPFPGNIRLSTYPKADWIDAKRQCSPCFIHSPFPCKNSTLTGFSPCYNNLNIKEVAERIDNLVKKND